MSSWDEKWRLSSKVDRIQELIGVTPGETQSENGLDSSVTWPALSLQSKPSSQTLIDSLHRLCMFLIKHCNSWKIIQSTKQTTYYWTALPAFLILYNFILIQVRRHLCLFKFQMLQPKIKRKEKKRKKSNLNSLSMQK